MFFEGRHFLNEIANCYVEPQLSFKASSSTILISINAGKVRCPNMTLRDFQEDPQLIEKFEFGIVSFESLFNFAASDYLSNLNTLRGGCKV